MVLLGAEVHSTWEAETDWSLWVQGQPTLLTKFQISHLHLAKPLKNKQDNMNHFKKLFVLCGGYCSVADCLPCINKEGVQFTAQEKKSN